MSKRSFIRCTLDYFLVLMSLLLAVGHGLASGIQSSHAAKITFMSSDKVLNRQVYDTLISEFMDIHPHIHVDYLPVFPGWQDRILAMMIAGTPPDVIWSTSDTIIPWYEKGVLLNLSPYIREHMTPEDVADFHPSQWGVYSKDGQQIAIPRYMGSVATFYNRNAFAQAGLPEPDPAGLSWVETVNITRKLTRDLDGDGVTDQWGYGMPHTWVRLSQWVWQNGADFHDPENIRNVTIEKPEFIEAWEFLHALHWEYGVAPTNINRESAFHTGKVIMYEDGVWRILQPHVQNIGEAFEIGAIETPYNTRRATYHTNDAYVIPVATRHPKEAFLFLQWITGKRANQLQLQIGGLFPSRTSQLRYFVRTGNTLDPLIHYSMTVESRLRDYARTTSVFPKHSQVTSLITELIRDTIQRNTIPVSNKIKDIATRLTAVLQ